MAKRRTDNTMAKRGTDNTMAKRGTDNTIAKRKKQRDKLSSTKHYNVIAIRIDVI
jgi:hypothetical protein